MASPPFADSMVNLPHLSALASEASELGLGRLPPSPRSRDGTSGLVCSCHGSTCSCVGANLTHSLRREQQEDDAEEDDYEGQYKGSYSCLIT